MKKPEVVLQVARRVFVAESKRGIRSPFKKGDKVKLHRGESLSSSAYLMIQYFTAGTQGTIVGHTSNHEVIISIEGENWVVGARNLKPIKPTRKGGRK